MIEYISSNQILRLWKELWPDRQSLPLMSSMLYPEGHDITIYQRYVPTFFGFSIDGNIIGVNSGHKTADNAYRSRGLYVLPEFRGLGIAQHLLQVTIQQAIQEECDFVWTLPRQSSFSTYEKAGFIQTSDFIKTDTSEANCYAVYKINDL